MAAVRAPAVVDVAGDVRWRSARIHYWPRGRVKLQTHAQPGEANAGR